MSALFVILAVIVGFLLGMARNERLRLNAFITGYSEGWSDRNVNERSISIVACHRDSWRIWYRHGYRTVEDITKLSEDQSHAELVRSDGHVDAVIRIYNAEDKDRIAIINATRGLSPECVAACVAAVKAINARIVHTLVDSPDWRAEDQELLVARDNAVAAAIALLPKEWT